MSEFWSWWDASACFLGWWLLASLVVGLIAGQMMPHHEGDK